MPVAYLPSPATSVWHLGTIPVRAYALCMVLGVITGLWLTNRRYCAAGGQPGVILNMATIAVPVGLVGARLYSVLMSFSHYFGAGRDWTDILRVWDGGMGVAGAVAAGGLAAWLYGRRSGLDIGPVALAAAPALPVAQAIAVWGNWFTQQLYGQPSGLPWAVAISPQHRVLGYQAAATFQPLFAYESLIDLLIAVAVSYAIRRYLLSGGTAFALYAALWAMSSAAIEALRSDYSPRLFGVRSNLLGMLAVLAISATYLTVLYRRRQQRAGRAPDEPAFGQRALRPRSSGATAGQLGLTGLDEPAGTPGGSREGNGPPTVR